MKLGTTSALDLELKGSVGSFKVGNTSKKESLEVKYILTHVGLNFEGGQDEKLLGELAPVREIFDFRSLDFDEIMQRDIDDSRVSADLIPYILDDSSKDLIKFFPPIVVIVLPVEDDRNKPADFYPEVSSDTEKRKDDPSGVDDWQIIQSGTKGKEVFRFEQPIVEGDPQQHDLVALSVNTSKCRLVIVDGQHRAMALLAIYRNLKDDWSDSRRKPFESYYQEWTPDFIKKFNLKKINLPMIVCTVPELDRKYGDENGSYDLNKASRSIFLTLNKHARKVSRSRNLLLDDSDLVSSFMRHVLSKIKNDDKNYLAESSLEIHNVELDQAGDKTTISSPMALTGVSHLYYLIEHLLLDSGDVTGVSKREGRFSSRSTGEYFTNALERLDGENKLGKDAANSITRNLFSVKDETVLTAQFMNRYGSNILQAYSQFAPFEDFARSTQNIKNETQRHADVHIKPMLFDGQGIARVFEEHKKSLEHRISEGYFKHDVPKIESFKDSLKNTDKNYRDAIHNFKSDLTRQYLSSLPKNLYTEKEGDQIELSKSANKFTDVMYTQVMSVMAFQAALICGFYTEYEKASEDFNGALKLDLENEFSIYLQQLGGFFKPTSFSKAKGLISLFMGTPKGDSFSKLTIVEKTPSTFREVVFQGEMTPDEWPKYKYLMLEIWDPNNDDFKARLDKERSSCRKKVFSSLLSRKVKNYCRENSIEEKDLEKAAHTTLFNTSFDNYNEMLKNLNRPNSISKKDFE